MEGSILIVMCLQNTSWHKGLGNQDNIAVILPNCVEFALIYFAAAKIGAAFTRIDNRLGASQINAILEDTGAKGMFRLSRLYT